MHAPLAFVGWQEIGLLVLIIALIFGARRLPEIGRGLGEGIRNFRGAMKEISDDSSANNKEAKGSHNEDSRPTS